MLEIRLTNIAVLKDDGQAVFTYVVSEEDGVSFSVDVRVNGADGLDAERTRADGKLIGLLERALDAARQLTSVAGPPDRADEIPGAGEPSSDGPPRLGPPPLPPRRA